MDSIHRPLPDPNVQQQLHGNNKRIKVLIYFHLQAKDSDREVTETYTVGLDYPDFSIIRTSFSGPIFFHGY